MHGVSNVKYNYTFIKPIIIFQHWTVYSSFSFPVANNFSCLDSSRFFPSSSIVRLDDFNQEDLPVHILTSKKLRALRTCLDD